MKTRNAFTTATICLLSALTIGDFVNPHKVEAKPIQPIKDCHQLVTGTYLTTTIFANLSVAQKVSHWFYQCDLNSF